MSQLKCIETHIEMLLDKKEQERIGADNGDNKELQLRVLRVFSAYNALQAENKRLLEYVKHKEGCEALKRYHVPECPNCGSKNTHWRTGVHFEHERMCGECDGPAWEPEERYAKCTCGLGQTLKGQG